MDKGIIMWSDTVPKTARKLKVFCQIREPIWKKDSRYGSNITLSIKTMQDWCDKRG